MEKRPDGWWKKKFVKVKAWTVGQKGEPYFPKEYEMITSDILQVNHPAFFACSLCWILTSNLVVRPAQQS